MNSLKFRPIKNWKIILKYVKTLKYNKNVDNNSTNILKK